MIDTHCHLYDPVYDADRSEVLQRAEQAGVTDFLMPGVDSSNYAAMMDTAAKYPQCRAMIGLHPTSIDKSWQQELDFVKDKLATAPPNTFIAIGEIGMDTYWSKEFLAEQKAVFSAMLALATAHNLPVVIHSRDAFPETFEVLQQHPHSLRGVFHAFSGDFETYKKIRQFGDFKVGVGGVITFKNAHLPEAVKDIPLHDILLETDAPYLTPAPFRGKRNESAYLTYIVQKIAEVKQITVDEVMAVTTQNAKALFWG
ncbi:TatD family hydrolase [Bacteroidia bacterium]|nr:TatD family hydrolase [Bacteroidia bacterium]